jgi:hypothetical protein
MGGCALHKRKNFFENFNVDFEYFSFKFLFYIPVLGGRKNESRNEYSHSLQAESNCKHAKLFSVFEENLLIFILMVIVINLYLIFAFRHSK